MDRAQRCAFIIFGITGDLGARKLLPALYALHRNGRLHPETAIIGYARSDHTDGSLRAKLEKSLERFVPDFDRKSWAHLAPRIHYIRGGYADAAGFATLHNHLKGTSLENRILYTATPPEVYESIALGIVGVGLNRSEGFTRLVIEKPFGTDLGSARELNRTLLQCFNEEQLYRIDHYLAKETAQNLAVLRFANTLFEPIWSNRSIDNVQITMAEPMGMEGRGEFYEQAGVIRDVFQNHLLQLVALVAMEPPSNYDATSVRNEKVKVFDAMAPLKPYRAVLGQYVASNGMPGYREEKGVAPDSRQATFAAVHFDILNWRWSGVPFFVRSGKRLEGKASQIVLQFKVPPHIPFTLDCDLKPDRLILRLIPNEGITIRFNGKVPGQGIDLDRISLNFSYGSRFNRPIPDAYETLLLDIMLGDATLFMRADEVESQWRVVMPLIDHLDLEPDEPHFYSAGSLGPKAAYTMLTEQGRHWYRPWD